MSYDVYFCADVGSEERPTLFGDEGELWRNYTSNVSRMWAEAIREPSADREYPYLSLAEVIENHPKASDLLPFVDRGIKTMLEAPEYFRQWSPKNGWGDYEGALDYLRWIAAGCEKYPQAYVEVSR